jgi:hypothetical protein
VRPLINHNGESALTDWWFPNDYAALRQLQRFSFSQNTPSGSLVKMSTVKKLKGQLNTEMRNLLRLKQEDIKRIKFNLFFTEKRSVENIQGFFQRCDVQGLTDTNVIFTASRADRSLELGIHIEKEGYYVSYINYNLYLPGQFDEQTVAANRTAFLTLTLKKNVKSIPMYAKSLNTHVPDLDKPIGYDFEIGDWVSPYGKGVNKDIFFTAHFDKHDDESDFTLTESFPNAEDGIQEFSAPQYYLNTRGSALWSDQMAPTNGYQPQWIQTDIRKRGKPIETNRNPNRNYYFRVRTKIDNNGNIVTTHYGKIYGDFMRFSYYFNPTPNSRNIEFDPKQNLLQGLKFDEAVKSP